MAVRKAVAKPSRGRKQAHQQLGIPFNDTLRLHTEVTRELKYALDRVCLERRQEGIVPHTQSDVVEAALWDWLQRGGYAKKA